VSFDSFIELVTTVTGYRVEIITAG
jgi:hypothetical protein